MVFSKNQVFLRAHDNHRLRVLWLQGCEHGLWYISIDEPNAWPELMRREEFVELVVTSQLTLCDDPFAQNLPSENLLSDADRKVRDRAWKSIKNIVGQEPGIYLPHIRADLIAEAALIHGLSEPTLRKHLRRFWQRGCVPNAVIPDFLNCGCKGKIKVAGSKKRGRPLQLEADTGLNITEDHLRIMRSFWSNGYLKLKAGSLRRAYNQMVTYAYPEYVSLRTVNNQTHVDILEPDNVPSLGQFRYWYEQETQGVGSIRRKGEFTFEQQYRHLHSNVRNDVIGPGTRYELDATIADVYLVKKEDRNYIVGRPTVYLVVDVFSGMIVGFNVGIQPPSYVGAMCALTSVMEDKVALCAKYGITITEEEWPTAGMCRVLLADRGEMISYASDALQNNLGVKVENTPPFHGESKPVVERCFGTVQAIFAGFLPGFVEKGGKRRGGPDYRLDAKLNVDEFTAIIIYSILLRNITVRASYPGTAEMARDSIPYVPLELWNWGIRNSYSETRKMPLDTVRFNLWPSKTARLDRKGLEVWPDVFYNSPDLLSTPWYLKAQENHSKLEVRYYPDDISIILVRCPYDRKKFYPCKLTEHSRRFMGMSLNDYQTQQLQTKKTSRAHESDTKGQTLGYEASIQNIIKQAKGSYKHERDPNLSNAERTKNLKKHRKEEIVATRQKTHVPTADDTVWPDSQADVPKPLTSGQAHKQTMVSKIRKLYERTNHS